MKKYYIKFIPEANVNYFYLFRLIDIAEYREETKAFDLVRYHSAKVLSSWIGVSMTTANRLLNDDNYLPFFNVDKKEKTITIYNSVIAGS